ncbi:unnamed protein product [Ilex paraguariensis]|uniref:Uncharacterized protein n=1 Tax=Ilex paraguariensis TaxID=185542 RepID=A0ABC8RT48_9AQUA
MPTLDDWSSANLNQTIPLSYLSSIFCNQQASESDRRKHWAIEDFMDSPISYLAQPKHLPKLGESEAIDEMNWNHDLIVMKKWNKKEKGSSHPVRTNPQMDPIGKRKHDEGNEVWISDLGGNAKKKGRVSYESRVLVMEELDKVTVGSGLQTHRSS